MIATAPPACFLSPADIPVIRNATRTAVERYGRRTRIISVSNEWLPLGPIEHADGRGPIAIAIDERGDNRPEFHHRFVLRGSDALARGQRMLQWTDAFWADGDPCAGGTSRFEFLVGNKLTCCPALGYHIVATVDHVRGRYRVIDVH